jgi:hypothetical protein
MDAEQRWEIAYGSKPWSSDPGIGADLALWGQAWRLARSEIMAEWIRLNPGRRPKAWHVFDGPQFPPQRAGESEVGWLHRIGELDLFELAAIQEAARKLAEYNAGRHPADVTTNFIPADAGAELLRELGRLPAEVVTILWPSPLPPRTGQEEPESRDNDSVKPVVEPVPRRVLEPVKAVSAVPIPETVPAPPTYIEHLLVQRRSRTFG